MRGAPKKPDALEAIQRRAMEARQRAEQRREHLAGCHPHLYAQVCEVLAALGGSHVARLKCEHIDYVRDNEKEQLWQTEGVKASSGLWQLNSDAMTLKSKRRS